MQILLIGCICLAMDNDQINKLISRLDTLISILMSPKPLEDFNDQEKISFLEKFEMKPAEMARILGKSSGQISKQLYKIKSKNK